MRTAPYTKFGQTRQVPVVVYVNGWPVEGHDWTHELWVESGEDLYAFDNYSLRNKRVRVIEREAWLRAEVKR